MIFFIFLMLSLATFRLTRLIVKDDMPLVYYPREWIIKRRPTHGMHPSTAEPYVNFWYMGELVSCPWCASAWVSGALTFGTWIARHGHGGLPVPVLIWLSVWGVGAWLAANAG